MTDDPDREINAEQQLLDDNARLRDQLRTARRELADKQRELESTLSEARTDALTGLRNRRALDEELNRYVALRERHGFTFSLLLIDVDSFKEVNDEHGHLFGDAILRQLADVLAASVRAMDMIARFGGDESAVLCPATSLNEALVAAERLRAAIADHEFVVTGTPRHITASIGAAEARDDDNADGLIRRADTALYAAKRHGRNCVRAASPTA